MPTFLQFLIVFLLGLGLGAGLIAWLCWAEFHSKLDAIEQRLHARLTSIETKIESNLHIGSPPAAATPPAATPPAAPPAN